jgi:hypothetical protein
VKRVEALASLEEFWEQFEDPMTLAAVQSIHQQWMDAGHRRRLGPNHVVLEAAGPSKSGVRTVVAVYSDGRVLVPFGSYAGQNSGIPIEPLTTPGFRSTADALFGFSGVETMAHTAEGWVTPEKVDALLQFCLNVAGAYSHALIADSGD